MTSFRRLAFFSVFVLAIIVGNLALTPGRAVSAWSVGTPIVTYWHGPGQQGPGGAGNLTEASARQVVDAGFNVVWASTYQDVQLAQSHGLRTMFQSDLLVPAALDGGAKQAQLNAMIDRLRTMPAHYAYFLKDEPCASEFAGLGALVAHIRARDPDHLAYINLLPNWANNTLLGTDGYSAHLSQYIGVVQPSLLSYDHYQLGPVGSDRSGYLLNLELVGQAAKQAGVPLMNIVQTSASGGRIPNANEMRFLVYSTLAYGAQGISYFQYQSGATDPKGDGGITWPNGTPTPIYATLQTLNPEFVAVAKQSQRLKWIGAYVKGYRSAAMPPGTKQLPGNAPFEISGVSNDMTYHDGNPLKGVLFGFFGADGIAAADATMALVENLDYTSSKTYIVTGPGNLSTFNATTDAWTPTGSNQATLNLPPGGGILVGPTSAVSAPPSRPCQ